MRLIERILEEYSLILGLLNWLLTHIPLSALLTAYVLQYTGAYIFLQYMHRIFGLLYEITFLFTTLMHFFSDLEYNNFSCVILTIDNV